jgi:tryptophanyl-tRNA synthetase
MQIEALINNRELQDVISDFAGQTMYGDLKKQVADSVFHFLSNFQEKVAEISDADVEKILEDGEKYANEVSREKLRQVQKAVGLYK